MSEETLTTTPAETNPGRILWVDAGRGFLMLYLVITVVFPPGDWAPEGSILFWLTGHPGREATYMTLFDIGAAAFIFILGLMYAVAFYKRKEERGTGKAIVHILIRYALISNWAMIF